MVNAVKSAFVLGNFDIHFIHNFDFRNILFPKNFFFPTSFRNVKHQTNKNDKK